MPEIIAEPAQYTTHGPKPPASNFVNRSQHNFGVPFQTIADFNGSNPRYHTQLLTKPNFVIVAPTGKSKLPQSR
jgi:hypothetical protein